MDESTSESSSKPSQPTPIRQPPARIDEASSVAVSRKLGAVVRAAFSVDLVPLRQPKVDPDFGRMGAFVRAIESLRYNATLVEFRMGQNGWVRAWAIATLRILVFILLPLTAALVLLGILVPVAAEIAAIFGYVEDATNSLMWATINFAVTLLVVAAVIAAIITVRAFRIQQPGYPRRRA